ncbi:hypothetical protein KKA00_03335, partial [bacterium]|nr:hypothetical protein [bacterium]
LFHRVHDRPRNNYYNELGICRKMGYIYLALNQPEEALKWVETGLSRELNDTVKERRKKTLKTLQELKIKAEKKIAEKSIPSGSNEEQ